VAEEMMTNDDSPDGWVNLSSAIEALRRDLATAWSYGGNQRVRFKPEPVELTVQAAVTKTGKGQAGVKWHILTIGGEKSRENSVTQTVKLKLAPVFYDDHGEPLPDQLLSGRNIFAERPDKPGQS
jgi:Trypsin-co-occurring domain 2